ncbi:MAG: penicillin-binding protein 2 [Alphaproteobacteria bacterium]|nr:penicillin-binding protein 2 [Alphaproteobacteria bacterium]
MELNDDARSMKSFSRRAFVIGALQFCFLGGLGVRLAWLQISQGQKYKRLSDRNRINIKMLAPSRGQIVDRFGVPLAVNNQNFRVLIVPEQAESVEKSLRQLQAHVDLSEEQIQKVLEQAKKSSKFLPLEVKDNLSWEDVARIEVNLPDLPGLSIDVGEVRSYPYGPATAHIVGYVGLPSKSELAENQTLNLPGFKIGKTGIEKKYDDELRGVSGASEVEVNVIGREVRELGRQVSRGGERVVLSIDAELQRFMQDRLSQQKSASAVVIDAHTGAVYGLASYPDFDPNLFTHGLSASAWEELLADPGHPLTNKAVAGQYPPASTFKMVTAIAGLRAGKITGDRTVFCSGHYDYGGDRFHCWKPSGHGTVNLIDALAMSCDTYFYQISTEIGIDNIAQVARELGLGEKLSFDLPEESPGLVPDKDWKMGYHGSSWKPGETIVASIGQGYLQATPLQLAVMTARLVNGGYAVKPWLSAYVGQHEERREDFPKLDIHEWHLHLVKQGMDKVVNNQKGTAYGSRIVQPDMAMGGKTGTAQVKRITAAQRQAGISNEELPWKYRHHGLFVGYAPVNDPRYVCCVVVEHGVGGSATAAPLARDILFETQKRDPGASQISPETVFKNNVVKAG